MSINLTPIGTYTTGVFANGAAEIPAYDPASKRLFVVNANAVTIDILDLSDPTNPQKIGEINATAFGAGANSVAVKNGIVAVAIENTTVTDPGVVVFFDANGTLLGQVPVGALPDMLTFTPDGSRVLVANEGEPRTNPDGTVTNPEGSISIIDISGGVAHASVSTATFNHFNGHEDSLRAEGVRIAAGVSASQDFEPEYIAVSADGRTAYVTLQENNAVAAVDIASARVIEVQPLGLKDHSIAGNGLDASDRDSQINIQPQPVVGMYMPDAIATFEANGKTYYITANEGDDRGEDARVAGLVNTVDPTLPALDPTAFPNAAELIQNANLGRLTVSTVDGDVDGDGDYDRLQVYGSRSFSIWDSDGNQVFDSGDALERITAAAFPTFFNSDNEANNFDNRSDNKGPEPEGVEVGVIDGRTYAFVGLERVGGIVVYDVTDPANSTFVQYINNRNFNGDPATGTAGDLGPEGLDFIAAADSPNGKPLLVVANEISGSTTIYEVNPTSNGGGDNGGGDNGGGSGVFTLQLLHASDQEAGIPALNDAPRFSAVLNALANEDRNGDGVADYANTIRLSSGDAYIPGLFLDSSADPSLATLLGEAGRGRADIIIQNELGFQAISFGNHEFDLGTAFINTLLTPSGNYPGANFPYLSSNLDFSTDANLAGLVTANGQEASTIPGRIAESTVVTINGERIGVVGATTPTLRAISSPEGVTILPAVFGGVPTEAELDALAAEIQASVDELLAANPDINKVILLSHMQQIAIEQALASRLRNVDIIMAGGSNTRLVDSNDRLRAGDTAQGTYPLFRTDADGNPVAIVNTDGNYKYVGRLVIDFNADGLIIPESYDPTVSGAYATDDQGVADLNAQNLVDPEILAITDALRTVIANRERNVFGSASVFLNGQRAGGGTDGVRNQETNLGNLTADANLAIAQQVDSTVVISLKNGGGIRSSIGRIETLPGATEPSRLPTASNELAGKPEGGISEVDVQNALAFNNGLTLVTVTAAELKALVEHGVAASTNDLTSAQGRFPQISGFSFSYDLDLPAGSRVLSLAIEDANGNDIDVVIQNGQVVGDPTRTFRMVTLNFLASGGDGYPFTTLSNPNRVDLALDAAAPRTGTATFAADGSEQDALAEYLTANFGTTPFSQVDTTRELDQRIQNLNFRADTVIDNTAPVAVSDSATVQAFGSVAIDVLANDSDVEGSPLRLSIVNGPSQGTVAIDDKGTASLLDDVLVYSATSFVGLDSFTYQVQDAQGSVATATVNVTVTSLNVQGTSGADLIEGSLGNDTLNGAGGRDTLNGNAGDDRINGGGGQDLLNGGAGNDTLNGGSGDDILVGGSGDDTLIGGNGDDTFMFASGRAFDTADFGVDNLSNFDPGPDLITLSATTFTALTSAVGGPLSGRDFAIVGSDVAAARTGAAIVYNRNNGNLFYNANGSDAGFGTGGQFAILEDRLSVNRRDFTVVA